MDVSIVLVGLIALTLGVLIGWLFAGRETAGARQTVESLRLQLDEVLKERDANRTAAQELAALRAAQSERDRAFSEQIDAMREAKEALSAQFSEIGGKLLGEAQKAFLERADARFNQAGERHEEKLKTLLEPVQTTLKRYEEGLAKVEKERVDHYAGLREAVELVRAGQGQVRDEARRLTNALTSSPKHRGKWGEQGLKNVLEQAGLSQHADFATEVSVSTDDGRLRPDVIVNLPGGRKLVIDAKCSLNAYMKASDEVDDEKREAHFKAHLASIKAHVQQLGSKAYWSQFGDAADYVVMYIPGEHFLNAALEQEFKDSRRRQERNESEVQSLWDWAFERRVLLATPANLVAIARTVASVWRQEKLAKEAAEIARLGKELHSRLATMAQHMERVGKNLSTANTAYNQMVGSFESQVFTQARRFETLGASSAKELPVPAMVEAAPRPITKLTAPKPSDDDTDA